MFLSGLHCIQGGYHFSSAKAVTFFVFCKVSVATQCSYLYSIVQINSCLLPELAFQLVAVHNIKTLTCSFMLYLLLNYKCSGLR